MYRQNVIHAWCQKTMPVPRGLVVFVLLLLCLIVVDILVFDFNKPVETNIVPEKQVNLTSMYL
jgi:hypothetical protein